jgi:hypothetical protein
MGAYANYCAVPPEVLGAYLDDFEGLAGFCDAPGVPLRAFTLNTAWVVVWCTLEPEAFSAVQPPERWPSSPAGILGAAVVGARSLNAEHSRERGEEPNGVYHHTRTLTVEEVRAAAAALDTVTGLDVARAYDSGVVARAAGRNVPSAETTFGHVMDLRDYYRRAAAEGMVVTVLIG